MIEPRHQWAPDRGLLSAEIGMRGVSVVFSSWSTCSMRRELPVDRHYALLRQANDDVSLLYSMSTVPGVPMVRKFLDFATFT